MEIPNLELHPIIVIRRLERIYGPDLELSFSRYVYVKQTVADERETFWIKAGDVTNEWLISSLTTLKPSWELALNSTVKKSGRIFHLPMIDFFGFSQNHYPILSRTFDPDFVNDLLFFNSGRSCHAYGTSLLSFDEWVKFMGRLLLCNYPDQASIVDQRWIGHRLLSGYAALRWSKNTNWYKQYPELLRGKECNSSISRN